MKKLNLIIWFSFLATSFLFAQNKKIIVETGEEILWAGVDRPGDLFLLFPSGEVQKFNNEGMLIGKYLFPSVPTLIDPGDGVQSFYYIRKGNKFGNLSADMSLLSEKVVDPAFAISPWLVCPSLRELWIFDSSDFSIKKTKLRSTTISYEASLKHLPKKNIEDYQYLREYQNYLFLLDKNAGVHLISSLGKFIRTLGEKGIDFFNFLGEEIYYVKGDELILIDLYTDEIRKLKLPQPCKMALVTDNTLYTIEKNRVVIYDFKP